MRNKFKCALPLILFTMFSFTVCDLFEGNDAGGTDKLTPSGPADYFSTSIGKLKYIPGGTFQRDATPTNTSTVAAFWMSEKEITRSQFAAVSELEDPSDENASSGLSDPVQLVYWYHALVFCNKLSMLEGLTPVYTIKSSTNPSAWGNVPNVSDSSWNAAIANWNAKGYRLPTEMEWMWAAMGADKADPGQINTTGYTKVFAGSTGVNAIDDYVWYEANSNNKTHPAGTKLANELGLFDMSGNVGEWCWDWYDVYPSGAISNYRGANSGERRIMRGGDMLSGWTYATVEKRDWVFPAFRCTCWGFRVIRL